MRESLFRGKRIDNGEWLEGYYVHLYDGKGNESHRIYTGWAETDCGDFYPDWYEVDPSTVGRYTGRTDKNGVKIFEGDIVEFFGMRGEIVQECGAFGIGTTGLIDYDLLESKIPHQNSAYFCFSDNFISLWEVFWNYEQGDNPLYEVEVIGNIHDNPELLEGGDEE